MIRTVSAITYGLFGSIVMVSASPPDVRTEIVQALRHDTREGFSGTASFVMGKAHQQWEITIDGEGQLAARITLPQSDLKFPLLVGESHEQLWFAQEGVLHVWDKTLLIDLGEDELAAGELGLARSLVNQAHAELDRLCGPQAERVESVSIEMLERSGSRPAAVVKIDGELLRASFERVGEKLVLSTIVQEVKGERTKKWSFAGYRRVGDRWVPKTAEFREEGKGGRILSTLRYAGINLTPIGDVSALQDKFNVLEANWAKREAVSLVEVHTTEGTIWTSARTGRILRQDSSTSEE